MADIFCASLQRLLLEAYVSESWLMVKEVPENLPAARALDVLPDALRSNTPSGLRVVE